MRENLNTDDIFGVARCFTKTESEAVDIMGQVAQDLADEHEADVTITKPDGKVVAEAFPAPRTKAFSFAGIKAPGGDSKAADYEKIFGHPDFVGDPDKTVA